MALVLLKSMARVEFHINLLNIRLTCAYVKVESFEKDNYIYLF